MAFVIRKVDRPVRIGANARGQDAGRAALGSTGLLNPWRKIGMELTRLKCEGDVWCSLTRLNLETVNEHGVYVIWHGGKPSHVVYVGQGDVADRLKEHRTNPSALASRPER